MKILLVEDDKKIANLTRMALAGQKYLVNIACDGLQAKKIIETEDFDLAILDIMLPDCDGYEVCRHIRTLGLKMPVLMLTARDSLDDKVSGLDAGADDYLTKPFALEELFARVRALLRRERELHWEKIEHREIVLDLKENQIFVCGKKIDLVRKEFLFLEFLLRHRDEVSTRTAISEHLWGDNYLYTSRQDDALNVLVSKVRKKLVGVSGTGYIKTINGKGYKLI
ncbi:MAG: response regulator transcription factor [Patescibacteria group bacterium]|jgi:two-component system response regulator MprA